VLQVVLPQVVQAWREIFSLFVTQLYDRLASTKSGFTLLSDAIAQVRDREISKDIVTSVPTDASADRYVHTRSAAQKQYRCFAPPFLFQSTVDALI
jgi:hypothetical protein